LTTFTDRTLPRRSLMATNGLGVVGDLKKMIWRDFGGGTNAMDWISRVRIRCHPPPPGAFFIPSQPDPTATCRSAYEAGVGKLLIVAGLLLLAIERSSISVVSSGTFWKNVRCWGTHPCPSHLDVPSAEVDDTHTPFDQNDLPSFASWTLDGFIHIAHSPYC